MSLCEIEISAVQVCQWFRISPVIMLYSRCNNLSLAIMVYNLYKRRLESAIKGTHLKLSASFTAMPLQTFCEACKVFVRAVAKQFGPKFIKILCNEWIVLNFELLDSLIAAASFGWLFTAFFGWHAMEVPSDCGELIS